MKSQHFTLVEVLISMAVVGIAAMGIFRLQIIGLDAIIHAELTTRAADIAESMLEQTIAEARAQQTAPEPQSGTVELKDLNVDMHWHVDAHDASGDFQDFAEELPYLWRLRCRVSWGRNSKSIEIERYVWDWDWD